MARVVCGIDLDTLGDQFDGFVPGRTLICDADGPAYRASATVKKAETAVKHFQQDVLTQMFLTKSEFCTLHLTACTSFKAGRFNIIAEKPYQGNRTGKAKPPLLEVTRQLVALPENWLPNTEVIMHHQFEADDGMIMQSYQLQEHGLIWSDDKDLRMTPYPYWEKEKGIMVQSTAPGSLFIKQRNDGTKLCYGYGLKFFWAQMLMGDTADNIKGVRTLFKKQCGAVAAFNYLNPLSTEDECANAVLDAYRAIDQNPLPEGWLLWLLRNPKDTFWVYLSELNLSPENKAFVYQCANRKWFIEPEEHEDGDA